MAQTFSQRTGRDRYRSAHLSTPRSTAILLGLSFLLAGLAIMLSLPRRYSVDLETSRSAAGVQGDLSPNRTHALILRESAVAVREAEVARREAELLFWSPGSIVPPPASILCPPCAAQTILKTISMPTQTMIEEIVVVKAPPERLIGRARNVLDRERHVAERERNISKHEERVSRREHDVSQRESWIMEQLIALGNDRLDYVDKEYYY
ncbi:hypothetical protein B0H10DRAFT_1892216 [Mycena sp. CBHHK59/15]|nr:hypothetical protein B0H10DRAFT_1892216 [Mycena sp. CBHHK59/15]